MDAPQVTTDGRNLGPARGFFCKGGKKAGKKYAFTLYVKYKFFFRKTIKQTAGVWVYVIAHISANPRYMCAGS